MAKAVSSGSRRPAAGARSSRQPVENDTGASAEDAAVAPPPAPSDGLDAFLRELSTSIDARIEQAKAAVEAKADELAEAQRALATLMAIKGVQDGTFRLPAPDGQAARTRSPRATGGGSTGGRSVRGEIPKQVMAALHEAGSAGLLPAEIFTKLQVDETGKQSVRNFLASSKKGGKLVQHKDKRYAVPA